MKKNKFPVLPAVKRFTAIVILSFIICNAVYAQNITNTLGTSGVFSLKHSSTTFLDLNQSDSALDVNYKLRLAATSTSSGIGVLYKGVDRFLHNYGTNNTFLGVNSGNFTMTGSNNTALGYTALLSNTTGNNNTAVGYSSLRNNTTGDFNTALGYASLNNNSVGDYNTVVGHSSLEINYSGRGNTAVGYMSLRYNYDADSNTAIGYMSLYFNSSGANNTAVGYKSLYNSTGSSNTAVGYNSLYDNTTGFRNTVLGYDAGSNITTGSNNIAIGYFTQVPTCTSSNQIRLGNTSITYAGIQVAWTVTSDRNLKSNILNSNLGLGFISKLRPVSYTRKNDESGKTEYGLIAQEVESVLQEEGVENTGMLTITDGGEYQLRYNGLLAPMIKAIQELKQENDELKKRIEKLEEKNILLSNNK